MLDFYEAEIAIMKAMHASTRHRIVVADHTKSDGFGKRKLGHLSEIDCLFMDLLSRSLHRSGSQGGMQDRRRRRGKEHTHYCEVMAKRPAIFSVIIPPLSIAGLAATAFLVLTWNEFFFEPYGS